MGEREKEQYLADCSIEEGTRDRFDPRVMQGLVYPTCVRFGPDNEEMYVCGRGEGVVWRITDFRP